MAFERDGSRRGARRITGLGALAFALLSGGAQAGTARLPDPLTLEYPGHKSATPARVELGKTLFFDPRLSSSGTMSCATCSRSWRGVTGCGTRSASPADR